MCSCELPCMCIDTLMRHNYIPQYSHYRLTNKRMTKGESFIEHSLQILSTKRITLAHANTQSKHVKTQLFISLSRHIRAGLVSSASHCSADVNDACPGLINWESNDDAGGSSGPQHRHRAPQGEDCLREHSPRDSGKWNSNHEDSSPDESKLDDPGAVGQESLRVCVLRVQVGQSIINLSNPPQNGAAQLQASRA